MTDPDELYTLRAQYWLGHYQLCLDEAKSIARRPMSLELKAEREEFIQRANLALGFYDKMTLDTTSGLKALLLKAQYEQATTDDAKSAVIDQIKSLLAQDGTANVQLYSAQLFLQHGLTKEALQCVHMGATVEHVSFALQIYLKLDRIDLAQRQLSLLKQTDEDAVLTSLGAIQIALATGRSTAADALHQCNALSEQYGPSPMLLNLIACAHMMLENYEEARSKLEECQREFPSVADTLINLVVCSQYLHQDAAPYISELKTSFPTHSFCQALARVETAFERDANKYKVKA